MKTPWQYAETGNEFSHQVALFQWCNMAEMFGPMAAADPLSYTVKDYARGYGSNGNIPIPELSWLFAIKNAGHGDAVRGARAAMEGVKAGVPDLFLPIVKWVDLSPEKPIPINQRLHSGLYIELKRPKSGRKAGVVSDVQTKWQEFLQAQGYCVEVCFGWEVARDALLKYLGRI
jgi:hypothetical protein